MSPLAKLLQIRTAPQCPREDSQSTAGRIWKRFLEVLRSAKVQRRVRRLEIVERVTLGKQQSIVLLRVDQREFVVGCCEESVVLLVPPTADPVKEQPKRPRRAKSQTVQPPVLAPVESVTAVAVPVKTQQPAKAKSARQIELPPKRRFPTKARLLKSFAGRTS